MFQTILLLALSTLVQSSGIQHEAVLAPVASVAAPPVVTASSSQYFERTFNRLVAAPVQPVIPVAPVAPAPTVFVEPITRTIPAPQPPPRNIPIEPNVAIAVATAHAATPVATILLPPYPFAPPPSTFGFLPPLVVLNQSKNESTTTTIQATVKEPETTTPLPSPSNTDNSFAQAPASTGPNSNFNQVVYGPPRIPPFEKPQKLKTSVEIVPVPLAYIAPPPIPHHHHHHHHHKPLKYVHYYQPSKSKLILRPVTHKKLHVVKVIPAKLIAHKVQHSARNVQYSARNAIRSRADNIRDIEQTTFKPFTRPVSKPPRL